MSKTISHTYVASTATTGVISCVKESMCVNLISSAIVKNNTHMLHFHTRLQSSPGA